jgi:hypothetical protein
MKYISTFIIGVMLGGILFSALLQDHQLYASDPPEPGSADLILSVMTKYHLGERSLKRIETAKTELHDLYKRGVRSRQLDKALGELHKDEMMLMEEVQIRKFNDPDLMYHALMESAHFSEIDKRLGQLEESLAQVGHERN